MTEARLVSCPGCARHARVSEPTCPFCGRTLPLDLRRTRAKEPRHVPGVGVSRAALYAFGVGTIAFATACASSYGQAIAEPSCPNADIPSTCTGDAHVEVPASSCPQLCDGAKEVYLSCSLGVYSSYSCTPPTSPPTAEPDGSAVIDGGGADAR